MTAKKHKPAPVFLVAFVEGGNLVGIAIDNRENLRELVIDLKPHHRGGVAMTTDDINGYIDALSENPGNKHRFEDEHGEADISVVNITGMKLVPGKEIW